MDDRTVNMKNTADGFFSGFRGCRYPPPPALFYFYFYFILFYPNCRLESPIVKRKKRRWKINPRVSPISTLHRSNERLKDVSGFSENLVVVFLVQGSDSLCYFRS
jgi:hypothetical protein